MPRVTVTLLCTGSECTFHGLYDPNEHKMRYCQDCTTWFHIQCMEETDSVTPTLPPFIRPLDPSAALPVSPRPRRRRRTQQHLLSLQEPLPIGAATEQDARAPKPFKPTKEMQELARTECRKFRLQAWWTPQDAVMAEMHPVEDYLPDVLMDVLLDDLNAIVDMDSLKTTCLLRCARSSPQ
ncbi:hypothetical protein NUW54_g13985 [Trametes sanguinea]|uniref:Uncharacterized protein n=1 Tax=Trametes sanguinea TaxID=158606 RepID=A0ACC1MFN5_9APHY|nr:hypothetical protein NUW54_g13985 [Trametes sanguinea]